MFTPKENRNAFFFRSFQNSAKNTVVYTEDMKKLRVSG